jgi:hypothetical protein
MVVVVGKVVVVVVVTVVVVVVEGSVVVDPSVPSLEHAARTSISTANEPRRITSTVNRQECNR